MLLLGASAAAAQSLEAKIDAVIKKSYIASGTCTTPTSDQHGWPAAMVRECIYTQTDIIKTASGKPTKTARTAIAQIVLPAAKVVVNWIVSACAKLPVNQTQCQDRVFKEGRNQSGYQFSISGNVLEDIQPANGRYENYSFRHGITVRISPGFNGSETDRTVSDQTQIMQAVDAKIIGMASGKARYWSTRPDDFKARFPAAAVPASVKTAPGAQAWAKLVQAEFMAALKGPENRLLEAWLCANAMTMFGKKCS